MELLFAIGLDLAAISVLVFALYYPRHRRRDLLAAYVAVNVGVLAACVVLSSATLGIGLGLGLFGVLSIIRLRSREIEHHEIAYYFAALTLGLIAGLASTAWVAGLLLALIVGAMFLADHPALLRRSRAQRLVLPGATADEDDLARRAAEILGHGVRSVKIVRLDVLRGTTTIDVRYDYAPQISLPEQIAPASPSARVTA